MTYAEKWFEEESNEVRRSEDGSVEIWWKRKGENTKKLEHSCPDVVVVDRMGKRWVIVDFTVPWDTNIWVKENEKFGNAHH